MAIRKIMATATPDYREFRVWGYYREWYLYEMRKLDGKWQVYGRFRFEKIPVSQPVKTMKEAYAIAEQHANEKP